jgi:hypothetical protein
MDEHFDYYCLRLLLRNLFMNFDFHLNVMVLYLNILLPFYIKLHLELFTITFRAHFIPLFIKTYKQKLFLQTNEHLSLDHVDNLPKVLKACHSD